MKFDSYISLPVLKVSNNSFRINLTSDPICEVVYLYTEWPKVDRNVAKPDFVLRRHGLESCRVLWLESGPK